MNCFCILLASFLNLLTHLQKPTICLHRIISRDVSLIVMSTLQRQLLTIFTSHQTIQFQCGARGSCSQCDGWNGIRLSPGETEETDRDVAGLNEGADCDPWVSQRCSTWAWSSSWKRWAGWHRVGSKWERWSIQLVLISLVGCSYMSVYIYFLARFYSNSPNREEIPANSYPHFKSCCEILKSIWICFHDHLRDISPLWLDLPVSPDKHNGAFERDLCMTTVAKLAKTTLALSSTLRQIHFKMSCKACVNYKGVQNKE